MTETVTRHMPWVANGIDISDCKTIDEAMKKSKLDWDVELQDLYRGPKRKAVDGQFAVVRTDTDAVLGTVGSKYATYSNASAFAFVDAVEGAQLQYAGPMKGGRVAYVAAKLAEPFTVADETFDRYLFFRTSHDGSTAVSANLMPLDIRCTNGMCVVVPGHEHRWSVPHVASAEERLAEATQTLRMAEDYVDAYKVEVTRLKQVRMTDKRLSETIALAYRGGERSTEELVAGTLEYRSQSQTIIDADRPTAWGALMAFTEMADHGREWRSANSQLQGYFDGWVHRVRSTIAKVA